MGLSKWCSDRFGTWNIKVRPLNFRPDISLTRLLNLYSTVCWVLQNSFFWVIQGNSSFYQWIIIKTPIFSHSVKAADLLDQWQLNEKRSSGVRASNRPLICPSLSFSLHGYHGNIRSTHHRCPTQVSDQWEDGKLSVLCFSSLIDHSKLFTGQVTWASCSRWTASYLSESVELPLVHTHSYKPGGRADKHFINKEENSFWMHREEDQTKQIRSSQEGGVQRYQVPEYVGVGQPVHELHLPEHVGSVAGQDVHLQGHHLTRHTMLHLDHTRKTTNTLLLIDWDDSRGEEIFKKCQLSTVCVETGQSGRWCNSTPWTRFTACSWWEASWGHSPSEQNRPAAPD